MNFYGRFTVSRRLWHGVKEPACTQGPVAERESGGLCLLEPTVFQGS